MASVAEKLPKSDQTLYLLDISSFIFRAFYAIRMLNAPVTQEPVNAVYGVLSMVLKLMEQAKPNHLVVAFDSKGPGFREEMYSDYKANRSEPPEDLIPQFARVDELVEVLGIPGFKTAGVEADDWIATLTRAWLAASPSHHVVIVTGDKDLMQLVEPRVRLWDTMNEKVYDPEGVLEKYGVKPTQICDYLGLVGDASDNIPGVTGIGPKGASDLLKQFETIEGVIEAAQSGKVAGKKGLAIVEGAESARLSKRLASLKDDLPITFKMSHSAPELTYKFEVTPKLFEFLDRLGFHTLKKKLSEGAAMSGPAPVLPAAFSTSVHSSAPAVSPAQTDSPAPQIGPLSIHSGQSFAAPTGGLGLMTQITTQSAPGAEFICVRTEPEFEKLLEKIKKAPEFGFDLETTSLNPRTAKLVGVALATTVNEGYYIPIGHESPGFEGQLSADYVLAKLKPYLESKVQKKIGQNLKFDWSVLAELGLKPDGIGADTMVAAYVLDPEGRHNMAVLAERYLNYRVMTYEEVCGKGKDQITFDQVPVELATRYSAEDAWVTFKLWRTLEPELKQDGLMQVFAEIDLPLVSVLARMESVGVSIDEDYLKELSTEFARDMAAIEKKVQAYHQGEPLNLNSTKQLAQLLFEELKLPPQSKTKTGFSTDASVLEALSDLHEVPRLLLEYREINKLKGTYVDPLPTMKDPKTGRIHAGFHQTVAATGRLSSSDPNLQNIPIRSDRGKRIRRAFIASPGNLLLGADYSQIELRLLAHMSGDADLVASFLKDEDVHRRTASEIFQTAPDAVDDRMRGIAKAINFGLMYGKTAFGLAQELGIPRKEAAQIIERYFARYSGVKRYLDSLIEGAREKGLVTTLFGRRRILRDIGSKNPALRANAERMAMNTPIQGTAADIMKMAMIELDARMMKKGFKAKLTTQVHDELLIDCPVDEADEVAALLTSTMENIVKLSIPLRVNASRGANWMEL